jgi:hypothetical protein
MKEVMLICMASFFAKHPKGSSGGGFCRSHKKNLSKSGEIRIDSEKEKL